MAQKTAEVVQLPSGYEASRWNATRHGILSRHTVLPWEDADGYDRLLGELQEEYVPKGPTERHLVETIAGTLWRQQRVIQAEGAVIRRGLYESVDSDVVIKRATAHLNVVRTPGTVKDAIATTGAETEAERAELEADQATLRNAKAVLESKAPKAYAGAVAALGESWGEVWQDALDGSHDDDDFKGEATAESLLKFIVMQETWVSQRLIEIERRPLIITQAIGQSINPDRLENLARYETHLDRKLERTIGMLLKLQDMRRSFPAPGPG